MTEIRYRRLLALYPSGFRREYEEEMLGVLMADPRPGPGQVFDLVRGALAARLRQPFAAGDDWRRAARVGQLFGAILLFAVSLRLIAQQAMRTTRPEAPAFELDTITVVRVTGWAIVVIATFLGFRLFALAGAITGLVGEIANSAQYYADTPATVLHAFWLIMTAVVVLVAGLMADRGPRPRGWPLVALAGVGIVGFWPFINLNPWLVNSADYWTVYQALPLLLLVVAGLGVWRQEPAVRRRVLVLAVPVLVTVPLVRVGFDGFVQYNQGHPEALRMLGPGHYAALVLIPAGAFFVAAELNRRLEATRAVSAAGARDK